MNNFKAFWISASISSSLKNGKRYNQVRYVPVDYAMEHRNTKQEERFLRILTEVGKRIPRDPESQIMFICCNDN